MFNFTSFHVKQSRVVESWQENERQSLNGKVIYFYTGDTKDGCAAIWTVELESFADESMRACLFHVMKGDRMMTEKVKLSTAEHSGVWTCFRCEAVFIKRYTCTTIRTFVCINK